MFSEKLVSDHGNAEWQRPRLGVGSQADARGQAAPRVCLDKGPIFPILWV